MDYKKRLIKELKEISRSKSRNKLEKAYKRAEDFCNGKNPYERCLENWKLNPMITCAYKCEIWKLKNKILKKINKEKR